MVPPTCGRAGLYVWKNTAEGNICHFQDQLTVPWLPSGTLFLSLSDHFAPGKASCHVWGHLQAYREPHLTMWEPRSLADSQPRINTWVIPGVEDHCTKSADDSSPNWQPDCSLKRDHETESLSEATPTFLSSANCEMRSFLFSFFKLPNLGTTTSSMTTLYLQELSDKGERHLAFYFHLGQWLLVVQVSWKLRIW